MSAHKVLGTTAYPYQYWEPGTNVDGELVLDDPVEIEIQARIQPKSDGLENYQVYSDAHRLSTTSGIAIYGDDVLHPATPDGLTPPGQLTYRDRVYVIVSSDDNMDKDPPHVYSVGLLKL